jgi:hypothetical protein
MSNQIVTLQYNDFPVMFQSDAWLNATTIAKSFNKLAADYLRLDSTKEYIEALQENLFPADDSNMGNPILENNQLVIVKNGAPETGGGTWLHPKLAVNFARWLSAKFAVWCDLQIEKLLQPKPNALRSLPPSPYISPSDRMKLKDAVNKYCYKARESHSAVYWRLFREYGVDKLELLPAGRLDEYLAFLKLDEPKTRTAKTTEGKYVEIKTNSIISLENFTTELFGKNGTGSLVLVNRHVLDSVKNLMNAL